MAVTRIEKSNPLYARDNTLTLTLHSSHLDRRQDVTVYNAYSSVKNLPIIFLLHGVYGNNWVWMDLGGAHVVYEALRQQGLSEFILVMPSDGGLWEGSAYLPLQQGNFEQWITDDVLCAVIQTVDAASVNSRLYISGLSMGGYGALRLGAKYADKFSGISAHSAITQIDDLALFTEKPISQYHTLDEHEADIMYWCKKHSANLPPIRLDCGKQDQLLGSNQRLVNALRAANVEHEYQELEGGHEWPYWHRNLQKTLTFFNKLEKKHNKAYI
jgi:enterochelin esterase-like enzyme